MSRVEWSVGSIGCEINANVASDAEHQLSTPALMHGSVTEQHEIGVQLVGVINQHLGQGRATKLFFTVEEEFDVNSTVFAICP